MLRNEWNRQNTVAKKRSKIQRFFKILSFDELLKGAVFYKNSVTNFDRFSAFRINNEMLLEVISQMWNDKGKKNF